MKVASHLVSDTGWHCLSLFTRQIWGEKIYRNNFLWHQFDKSHIIAVEVSQLCEKDIRHCCILLLTIIVAVATKKSFGNDNNRVSWQDIDNIQWQFYPKKLSKINDQIMTVTGDSDEDFNSRTWSEMISKDCYLRYPERFCSQEPSWKCTHYLWRSCKQGQQPGLEKQG